MSYRNSLDFFQKLQIHKEARVGKLVLISLFIFIPHAGVFALSHSEKISNFSMYSEDHHHLSRSRFQFEGSANQPLNDHWDIEASTRIFGDLGVSTTDYSDDVQEDEKWEAKLRSLSLEYHALPFHVRVGLQQVVWGEALHYFSADLLHPKDLRDFFLNDLEWARIPQAGAFFSYDDGRQSLQLVYFAYSEVHHLPRYGSEFFLNRYGVEQYGLRGVPVESKYDFSKPTLGANYGVKMGEWNLHAMAVFSKDFQRYFDGREFKNNRLLTGAFTASYAHGDFLFRYEQILNFNRELNTKDSIFSVGSETHPQLTSLPVLEYSLTDDLIVSQQIYWLQTLNCPDTQILPCRTVQHGSTIRAFHLPLQLEFETSAWIEYRDPSAWWSTKFKRPFGDRIVASLGVEEFFGSGTTVYSELSNRDQIVGRVEYSF